MGMPLIARAWSRPPRSFALPTTPGRRVEFHGGEAYVYSELDMPFLLRREDLVIEPDPRYLDWLPDWLSKCGERTPPLATLQLPEGYSVGDDYTLLRPDDAGGAEEATATSSSSAPRRRAKKEPEPEPEPVAADDLLQPVGSWTPPTE